MRQKRLSFFILGVFLAFALIGCPGGQIPKPQVMEPVVITYEGSAVSLNIWKNYIKGQEIGGSLKSPELDARIAEWEQARLVFIKAGDILKAALNAPDTSTMNIQMAEYNRLLSNLALEIGKAKVPDAVKADMTTKAKGGTK